MLKAPDHQVAGHCASRGQLGPLTDDRGRFYKPLQNNGRGSKEVNFYKSFTSDPRIPVHIRKYFLVFYGVETVEASDGSGLLPHMVLEDLVRDLKRPSVVDVKMGSRTWYPQASEEYFKKSFQKDKESTTQRLGFRISGLQVHESNESNVWKPSRKHVVSYTTEEAKLALEKFVSSNPSSCDSKPDCAFASVVYGGILEQLLELKSWFEDQTIFHFCSVSILMFWENGALDKTVAKVKLVDFAHVLDAEGIIDHNFLGGLCSLIKVISEILTRPDSCIRKWSPVS